MSNGYKRAYSVSPTVESFRRNGVGIFRRNSDDPNGYNFCRAFVGIVVGIYRRPLFVGILSDSSDEIPTNPKNTGSSVFRRNVVGIVRRLLFPSEWSSEFLCFSCSVCFQQMQHPSALEMFEKITEASGGKQIVMFLDYDGTLSPIVDDPDRAFMSSKMRRTIKKLAKCFPTAIVTGRCIDKVYNFVKLAELYYAGSHGMDIKGPAKGFSRHKRVKQSLLYQPAGDYLPIIDEVYRQLLEKTKSTPGVKVENHKFCTSVHFRCVDEKKWSELVLQVRSVLKEYPTLKLTQGRKVFEIRPMIEWDKGKALEFLLESLGFGNSNNVFPVYIGDDRTDEDAFKMLRDRGEGCGILVSKFPKDTDASYCLQDPSQVMSFLRRLVEWKQMQLLT